MPEEIDAGNVERYDRAPAGFGTRHTLSSQTDPNRGIGAAGEEQGLVGSTCFAEQSNPVP